jgi:hypothetical protein
MFVKTPDGVGRVIKEFESMVSVRLENGFSLMYLKSEVEEVKSNRPVPRLPKVGTHRLKELHAPAPGRLTELQ